MSTDDILWKKVDHLKSQEARKPEPPTLASRPSAEKVTASDKLPGKSARSHASKQDNRSPSNEHKEHASTQTSTLTCYPQEWIEAIRKVVKATGKEVAFTRLTLQEKGRLTDVVYGFRRQGIKTSENEVLRIAINHLLEDFEECGKHSFLQKVIEALLA